MLSGTLRRHLQFGVAALLVLGTLTACGDSAGDGGLGSGEPREGYPGGPYGTAENTILADLTFTRPNGDPFSLREIYADGANRLLLISTGSGWCAACVEEQRDLESLHTTFGSRGLYVFEAIFEDADFRAANAGVAADWIGLHGVTFRVVADEAFQFGDYYNRDLTPMVMLVDVATMKILRISTGWDESATEAIIRARL